MIHLFINLFANASRAIHENRRVVQGDRGTAAVDGRTIRI